MLFHIFQYLLIMNSEYYIFLNIEIWRNYYDLTLALNAKSYCHFLSTQYTNFRLLMHTDIHARC